MIDNDKALQVAIAKVDNAIAELADILDRAAKAAASLKAARRILAGVRNAHGHVDNLMGHIMSPFITREQINRKWLQDTWRDFEDTPVVMNEEGDTVIDADFYIWKRGTSREDIWHWFDERCANGIVKDLMHGGEA